MARWRGVLLDVGGVLRVGARVVPGAAEVLEELRRRGVPFALLSNTSSTNRRLLAAELRELGLGVNAPELLTATTATAAHLRRLGGTSLFLVRPQVREDLEGLPEDERSPDHVVVGDSEQAFTREGMNRAFAALRAGADLIAMARNRWFATPQGPAVDIGAVVAGLEYAAQVQATLVGKPAAPFFAQGVALLGLRPEEVVMVGDDPEADVQGAQDAGLGAVLVGEARGRQHPDAIVPSIAGLPALLGGADGG